MAALALTALVLLAAPADAHAFLVTSSPAQGARLAQPPTQLTLDFTESLVSDATRVTIATASGHRIPGSRAQAGSDGRRVSVPLPGLGTGVYVVDWSVLSEDGHRTEGEYAFAVGAVHGKLPETRSATGGASILATVASATFLLGLALALGGLASERFVWQPVVGAEQVPRVAAGAAVGIAAAGAVLQVLTAFRNAHASLLQAIGWRSILTSRAGAVVLFELAFVVYALWLLVLERWRRIGRARTMAVGPLAAAAALVGVGGHVAASGTWWSTTANSVHVVLAMLWLGALAHLVSVAWRSRHDDALCRSVRPAATRYARLALVGVPVLLLAGVGTAFGPFDRFADLWQTRYGLTLLVKLGLVVVVLGLALAARVHALPRAANEMVSLRTLTRAESGTLIVIVVISALLASTAPPNPSATSAATLLGPPPLGEPVVHAADLAGNLAVYLSAAPDRFRLEVIAPDGNQAAKTRLTLTRDNSASSDVKLFPRRCGDGCFTLRTAWSGGTTRLRARVSAPGWTGGTATVTVEWPPGPDATAELNRVVATMRAMPTIALVERVSSGPHATPPAGTIDLSGAQFAAEEPYTNGGVVDARMLEPGGGLTPLSFSIPGSQIWETLWVDTAHRIVRQVIVDPGHRIDRTFTYPSAPA